MKRGNIIFAGIIVFSSLVAFGFLRFSSKPSLTIYLRCDTGVSGMLFVAFIPESSTPDNHHGADLETFCAAGKIEIPNYQTKHNIQFILKRGNGEMVKLIATYGHDIQGDQDGFYTVLKIMNAAPFIVNDRI